MFLLFPVILIFQVYDFLGNITNEKKHEHFNPQINHQISINGSLTKYHTKYVYHLQNISCVSKNILKFEEEMVRSVPSL